MFNESGRDLICTKDTTGVSFYVSILNDLDEGMWYSVRRSVMIVSHDRQGIVWFVSSDVLLNLYMFAESPAYLHSLVYYVSLKICMH